MVCFSLVRDRAPVQKQLEPHLGISFAYTFNFSDREGQMGISTFKNLSVFSGTSCADSGFLVLNSAATSPGLGASTDYSDPSVFLY